MTKDSKTLRELATRLQVLSSSWAETLIEIADRLDKAQTDADSNASNQNKMLCGIREIDDLVGGFHPGQISCFCGEVGSGKMKLMAEIMESFATQQKSVVFFTVDYSVYDILTMFSMHMRRNNLIQVIPIMSENKELIENFIHSYHRTALPDVMVFDCPLVDSTIRIWEHMIRNKTQTHFISLYHLKDQVSIKKSLGRDEADVCSVRLSTPKFSLSCSASVIVKVSNEGKGSIRLTPIKNRYQVSKDHITLQL